MIKLDSEVSLLRENFHKLSKETKILKIEQYLSEIGNYNYFENFLIFFRDKFGLRILQRIMT